MISPGIDMRAFYRLTEQFSCDEEPSVNFIEEVEVPPEYQINSVAAELPKETNPNESQSYQEVGFDEPKRILDKNQEETQCYKKRELSELQSRQQIRKYDSNKKPKDFLEENICSGPRLAEKVSKSLSQSLELDYCFQSFIEEKYALNSDVHNDFKIFAEEKKAKIRGSIFNYHKIMRSKQSDEILDRATATLDKEFTAYLKHTGRLGLLNLIQPRPNYLSSNSSRDFNREILLSNDICDFEFKKVKVEEYQPSQP